MSTASPHPDQDVRDAPSDPPLLIAFRVLATIVGVLLVLFILVAEPLARAHQVIPSLWPEGSDPQRFGEAMIPWVAFPHGWIYIAYLIVAFVLSRRAAWSVRFTVLSLLAGLIPVVTFFVERRATAYTRAHMASAAYDTDV